jgi:hypothetical protein
MYWFKSQCGHLFFSVFIGCVLTNTKLNSVDTHQRMKQGVNDYNKKLEQGMKFIIQKERRQII